MMYTKVFSSMFDGTLRSKGPWQALVTFQQMLILSNWSGVIDMTREAISIRTGIPIDVIDVGIDSLEKADPDSRSHVEDGRRIVRLDDHRNWGWRIVNFVHYRKIQSEERKREYDRNWVMEKRGKAGNVDKCRSLSVMSRHKDLDLDSNPLAHSMNPNERIDKKKKKGNPEADPNFAAFWQAYPRKVAKVQAIKAWAKLAPSTDLSIRIIDAVKRMSISPQWRKDRGEFIPYPSTFLNGRRFNDEGAAPPSPSDPLEVAL